LNVRDRSIFERLFTTGNCGIRAAEGSVDDGRRLGRRGFSVAELCDGGALLQGLPEAARESAVNLYGMLGLGRYIQERGRQGNDALQ
jgi:hypothetical protein